MNETLVRLTRIDGSVESARILNFTPIVIGTQEGKAFIDVQREGKEISHMVKRTVEYSPPFRGSRTSAQHYMELWKTLGDAGIPVVEEVVALSDTEVAETNVTADGSKLYGKDTNNHENTPSPVDAKFRTLDLNEVRREAVRIARLASENHILLSQDHCLDLLVHPDGTWAVIARDIKNTHPNADYPIDDINASNAERMVSGHLQKTKEQILAGTSI